MKKVVITQSNFLPWIGYFDLIQKADVFVVYDIVQFTRRDWRNRNRIKGPVGAQWLTIPVQSKGNYNESIENILLSDEPWPQSTLKTIQMNYARAPFFKEVMNELSRILLANNTNLHHLNVQLLRWLIVSLNIKTKLVESPKNLYVSQDKNLRLIEITKSLEGQTYISGPAAKSYMSLDMYKQNNINVEFMEYPIYPKYPQLFGPFIENLSVLDVVMNVGFEGAKKMLS